MWTLQKAHPASVTQLISLGHIFPSEWSSLPLQDSAFPFEKSLQVSLCPEKRKLEGKMMINIIRMLSNKGTRKVNPSLLLAGKTSIYTVFTICLALSYWLFIYYPYQSYEIFPSIDGKLKAQKS